MYEITLDKEDFLRYQLFTSSKSKRIKNKRIRTWILMTFSFLMLGLVLRLYTDSFLSYYFIVFSIITLIFYPLFQRRQYRKHYEKHIAENYQNRIGIESEIGFEDGFMINKSETQEGKIKLSEIQEISEITDNLFIKIKTGESVIIPKNMTDFDKLKDEFLELISSLDITWNKELDRKWK